MATNRTLETRVEKLEASIGRPKDGISAIIRRIVDPAAEPGELYGYRCDPYGHPTEIIRMPGESDDALLNRAELAAPYDGTIPVLHEMRQ